MASPVTNPGPLGYWGIIQAASEQRLTTAALWQSISAYEQAQGISRPAGLFQAVSQLRSLAVSQREAAGTLAKAGDADALTADMISQAVNARPLGEQSLAPNYIARVEVSVLTNEGASTQWLSVMFQGGLPTTKGDLIDQVTQAAAGMATGYGSVFTGLTGNLQLQAK